MERKIYMLIRSAAWEGGENIGAYSQEYLAAAECVRLNKLAKQPNVHYYVEEWALKDA